jgi:hypothetical protein
MKIIGKIVLALILISGLAFAQQKPDDLQRVKDALVSQTLLVQDLEKQNLELKGIIQRVGDDLKLIKTVAQLDSLKTVYGIVVDDPKKKKVRNN